MKILFHFIVVFLIIVENSIFKIYPHNSIALSFFAFINYKDKNAALVYTLVIPMIIGFDATIFAFFVFLYFVINQFYKYAEYELVNLIVITLIEIVLFTIYLYFFKTHSIMFFEIFKQLLYLFLFNYIFYEFDQRYEIL